MSGVRRTQQVTCRNCGSSGVLKLGMAMLNAVEMSKEFTCAGCGGSVQVSAPRAILALDWEPPTREADGKQPEHLAQ